MPQGSFSCRVAAIHLPAAGNFVTGRPVIKYDLWVSPDSVAGIRSAHGIRRILRFVILSGVERSRRIFAPNVCIAVTKVRRFFDSLTLAQNDSFSDAEYQLEKMGFGV